MVIPFPQVTDWTRSELALIETARKALEDREALKHPRARQSVTVTCGTADAGDPWSVIAVGDEDSPSFSVSFQKTRDSIVVLTDQGECIAVTKTLAQAIDEAIGAGLVSG